MSGLPASENRARTGIKCPVAYRAGEGMKHVYLHSHSYSVYFLLLCSDRMSLISLCCHCLFKNIKDTQPVSMGMCASVFFFPCLFWWTKAYSIFFFTFQVVQLSLLKKSLQSVVLSLILLTVYTETKGLKKICCAVLVLSASGLPVGGMNVHRESQY